MRAQRIVLFALVLCISIVFYGCQSNNVQENSDSETLLRNMKTYEVTATVTFLEDTQANIIKMKQKLDVNGAYTMVIESPEHLKGYKVSYANNEVIEYNPVTQTSYKGKVLAARNEILLGSFVAHYLADSNAKKEVVTLDQKKMTCFEATIPGDYKYMKSEKLWFDEATKSPVKMEIIGVNGQTSISIQFEEFKYN